MRDSSPLHLIPVVLITFFLTLIGGGNHRTGTGPSFLSPSSTICCLFLRGSNGTEHAAEAQARAAFGYVLEAAATFSLFLFFLSLPLSLLHQLFLLLLLLVPIGVICTRFIQRQFCISCFASARGIARWRRCHDRSFHVRWQGRWRRVLAMATVTIGTVREERG